MFAKMDQDLKENFQTDENLYKKNNSGGETKNEDNSKGYDELSSLIKDIQLNNLNDYYDIETNLFKKRIEKLNLKFYWIYESILGDESNNNLIYPYNKLFLILFKEISLYIEEILRLNKQLTLKNKNEKYYIQKLNEYKDKEKDFLINKQLVKNMQRNERTLEKNNEKLRNEIDKLNKKISNINSPLLTYRSNLADKTTVLSGGKLSKFNNSKFYNEGAVTEQGSIMSSGSYKFSNKNIFDMKNKSKGNIGTNRINSNSSMNTKDTNLSPKINNKDIIYLSISQCDEEINNLNKIENLLMKCSENKKKGINKGAFKSYKGLTPEKYNISNQGAYTTYKKNINNNKRVKKSNKSIDFKINTIINNNKF